MKRIQLIVATDLKNGIGRDNDLPWRLSADLKFFQKTTIGSPPAGKKNAVIMGRKTWESLPKKFRPLPNRHNVIITRQTSYDTPEETDQFASLEQAIDTLSHAETIHDIFIVGGGELYKAAITHPQCHAIFRTLVQTDANCTVFFPTIPNHFDCTAESEAQTENDLTFTVQTYTRNSN